MRHTDSLIRQMHFQGMFFTLWRIGIDSRQSNNNVLTSNCYWKMKHSFHFRCTLIKLHVPSLFVMMPVTSQISNHRDGRTDYTTLLSIQHWHYSLLSYLWGFSIIFNFRNTNVNCQLLYKIVSMSVFTSPKWLKFVSPWFIVLAGISPKQEPRDRLLRVRPLPVPEENQTPAWDDCI